MQNFVNNFALMCEKIDGIAKVETQLQIDVNQGREKEEKSCRQCEVNNREMMQQMIAEMVKVVRKKIVEELNVQLDTTKLQTHAKMDGMGK